MPLQPIDVDGALTIRKAFDVYECSYRVAADVVAASEGRIDVQDWEQIQRRKPKHA
jgi:hypothetical protein